MHSTVLQNTISYTAKMEELIFGRSDIKFTTYTIY